MIYRSSLFIFLCLVTISRLASANGPTGTNRSRGYIFTSPKRLIAGEMERVCLSLHNLEPPVHVSVDLLASSNLPGSATPSTNLEDDILGSVKATLKSGIETCLELRVTGSTKYRVGKLKLSLKFDKHPEYVVEAEKKVFIEHDALVTFVETDKAVYKSGQDVNIRVLTLKHDLKPWMKPISKVWLENPSEVRVAQWTNVTTENGMAQLSFPLSAEPSSGIWRIKVEKFRPQLIHTSTFEVRKYVLPRFQVTIGAPNYILADANNATWKVCVRYSYGEPVKGTLLLSLRPQTPVWKRKQTIAEIKYEAKFDASSGGCTNYTVSAQTLGLPHWKVAPNNVVLLANFTEAKSGVVETASSRTLVMHQPLKLEFAPHTPKYFKPGLPYHGKLRVLRPDASNPAPNEKIQLCLRIRRKDEWQRSVVECRNFTSSNADGYLDFIVPPQHKNIVLLSFVATAVEYPTKYYSPDKRWRVFVDQPSAYIDVEPWYSPSSSYLEVTRAQQPIVCGEKYSFNVMYTSGIGGFGEAEPIAFHYSINSKGDLLVFGHVKYKPRKDTILDYSEFQNLLGATNQSNIGNANAAVHRFPLTVKITASMAPVSELLLYYVRPDGEVVTTSHNIEIGHCFENKVKMAWREDRQNPGSPVRFHLEAAPQSLCGISAVDKSTKFLGPSQASHLESNLVDPETTFARLKPYHLTPEALPIQSTWTHCDKSQGAEETGDGGAEGAEEEMDHLPRPVAATARNKRHSVTYNACANYVDAIQAFDDFGAIVMSDLTLESRPCPPWRSSFGRIPLNQMSQEDMDEPDRMLKAVKAMPLAFQFSGPGGAAAETSAVGQDVGYADPASLELQTTNIVRSYFPETWIWELVAIGEDGKVNVERRLPDAVTDWIGRAVCISAKQGLGIGAPVQLTAFQPFFLDFSLPFSVKRGEHLRLKVSLFNYMQHSLPVLVQLLAPDGLELDLDRSSEAHFCLGPKDSAVHEYLLLPRRLGHLNVTVVAELEPGAEGCGPETLIYTRDEVVKPVWVKAEGFPVEISRSAFLCPMDFGEDSSLVWELELPNTESGEERLIEGSAKAQVSLIGDVLGPALDNLDRLVRLPMGCGEQNMILFVPNIHAIAYLDAINRNAGSEMKTRALRNMQKGYERELNYRHPDGSYSAFGAADETGSGSMWLTAFVVKSFAQARSMIQIDERDLKLSVKWIVRRQLENGCFPVVGQVFHKDMKGGLREEDGSSSALTAYVLVALLESGVPLSAALVNNALYCLEKASASDQIADSPYAGALATYALALLEHPRANESLRSLLSRASRLNDAIWWEDRSRPDSLTLSIETTAYAVLSLVKLGGEANIMEALKAVRWMSKKRNAQGGFSSTQDTVLGLEALAKYALAVANASATNLFVLVTATDVDRVFAIGDENRTLLNQIDLPTLPTTLELFAGGAGCLLVQSSLRYNKAKASGSEAFDLSASTETVPVPGLEGLNDACSVQRLNVCSRYKLPDEESNMAVLEVNMVSGFVPDRGSLHDLLNEPATGVKRFEENDDMVAIYFDKLTAQKTCIAFLANRENVVDNMEPGHIKLYDYYQQELTVSTSYTFASVCDNKSDNPVTDEGDVNEPMAKKMQQEDDRQLNDRVSTDDDDDDDDDDEILPHVDENFEKMTREKKINDALVFKEQIASVNARATTADLYAEEGSGELENNERGSLNFSSPIFPSVDVIETSFINVDHELETPNGIEGPVPVYVEAPRTTATPRLIDESLLQIKPTSKNVFSIEKVVVEGKNESRCPRCEEELPSDIKEIFCSSASAVKAVIRQSRKAHLILDLGSSNEARRLRSTVELTLRPECTCPPLDRPGIMALLLSSDKGRDFSKSTHKTKAHLDNSNSLFLLQPSAGTPREIKEARLSCPIAVNA